MSQFLPFIVIGITTGTIYGLAGTGLVLTYKTSGIFNFAYGSVATVAVFVFYFLHVQHGVAWPLAALLSVGVMGPVEGLVLERLARALDPMSPTLKVVATVGLLLAVLGLGTIWYGGEAVDFPQFLPAETFRLVGVNVQWSQLIVTVVSVLATGILYYFFRFVRLGVSMRGVVDNPDLVSMTGQSPAMVRRWAWVIGSVFASLAGLLLAPNLTLSALTLTMLVVQAFGAAAVGYFSNLPLTFVGGLVIGIPAALATKYVVSVSWLSGLPVGLPFILLFIVLIVTPRARLVQRRLVPPMPLRVRWRAPAPARVGFGVVILAAAALVPTFAGGNLSVWSTFLVDVMLFLSLGLLVRKSGQISLCHLAFAAIGAAAFGHFTSDWHIPWLAALALAGLVAVPVGALIAIPAIRLSGVFLAVATFGFGILLQQVLYTTGLMFGATSAGIAAPRPNVDLAGWNLGSDTGFYYLLLVFAVLGVVTVLALQHGRMGRLLGGLADSPSALETHGAATAVTRVLLFCITAAMASVAGALLSSLFSYASGANFDPFTSLTMVAIIVIVLGADPWYAIMASLGFAVFPGYVTVGNVGSYLQIAFGFSAMVYAMRGGKAPTVPVPLQRLIERLGTLTLPFGGRRSLALLLATGDGAPVPAPAGAAARPAMAGAAA
ncbi:MAG: branched-chain amino acid ABC transporter permease, partial [Acidimicrobiales bacterium]